MAESGFTLSAGVTEQVPLCMTDQSSRGTNLCCISPMLIRVLRCADGVRYSLTKKIPASICGNLCLSPNYNCEL